MTVPGADSLSLEDQARELLERSKDADGCPYCGGVETRVVDTKRPKRRRECQNPACKRRYNTREVIDAA